jgi:5-hydroxytryptamine receptor 2
MNSNGSLSDKIDDSGLIISVIRQQNSNSSYHWSSLLLIFFSIVGIIGNLLVCLAIGTERRLHNRTNWFLFSLALADMIVSGVVIPLAIVKEFTGTYFEQTISSSFEFLHLGLWILGPVLCDLWIFLDVCSCTSSIMHIVVISIDRYLAIKDPLNVRSRQEKHQICLLILLIWLIAIFLSSPMIVLGVINPYNIIINGQCLINNQFFVIYGSVVSFVIPLIIVIVMYALTVHRLKKQIKQCQSQFAQEQINNTANLVTKPFLRRQTASTNVLNTFSQSTPISATELRRKRFQRQQESFDLSEESLNNICLRKNIKSPLANHFQSNKLPAHAEYACPKNPFCQLNCTCNNQQSCLHCCQKINPKVNIRLSRLRKSRPISLQVSANPCQSSPLTVNSIKRPWNRLTLTPSLSSTPAKSSAVRNEQKAVKVLGVVFVIFVIAWFPFCILNLLQAVCKRCSIDGNILNGFVWLGYVSSSINPVVYTIFNRNFRLKFITLLKCQCLYQSSQQRQLSYYQSHSSLHGSRLKRTNGLVQNDIRRFNAHRVVNEPILV